MTENFDKYDWTKQGEKLFIYARFFFENWTTSDTVYEIVDNDIQKKNRLFF